MSDSSFLKCVCENCQGHLEFPAHAAGITTTCPHCGVETKLIGPEPASQPALESSGEPSPAATELAEPQAAGSKSKRWLNLLGSVLVGLAVAGYFGWKGWRTYRKSQRVVEAVQAETKPAAANESPAPVAMPAAPTAPATSVVLATGTPPARRAGEDLQVLSFEVHKAKDGNLQYIVGVVTNHAARQYFNVKLGFELTRAGGKAGDTASDTLRNLPANVGSTFKVNVIGTAPVTGATLAKLEGEKE